MHQQPTNKLVSTPSEPLLVLGQATGNTNSLDSPQPKLGGSHHLPPYSILCVTLPHPHSNGFCPKTPKVESRNCPKLSRFGLPGLHKVIILCSNLRSGRGMNQTCSSP